MAVVVGHVDSISINPRRVTFTVDDVAGPETTIELFKDESNTAIVPQLTLASRSWMLALLQNALTNRLPVIVNHTDRKVDAIMLVEKDGLNFGFDFNVGSTKRPPGRPIKPPKPPSA
jgi:hypothetical protein